MKEPKQYIFDEWDAMCAKANRALHKYDCQLLEDEVLVEMHKYVGALRLECERENERLKLLLIDCFAELKAVDGLIPLKDGLLERIQAELNV